MAHGDYERLTPQAIDQVWLRLRAGEAAKPTARELGLCTGTVHSPRGRLARGALAGSRQPSASSKSA